MPYLPQLPELTTAQAQTLLSAFAPYPGATQAETVQEFKTWYRLALIAETKRRLRTKKAGDLDTEVATAIDPIETVLAPPAPAPTTIP